MLENFVLILKMLLNVPENLKASTQVQNFHNSTLFTLIVFYGGKCEILDFHLVLFMELRIGESFGLGIIHYIMNS